MINRNTEVEMCFGLNSIDVAPVFVVYEGSNIANTNFHLCLLL